MQEITHGALFSGSGGFELAARMCGIKSLWASEIEPFPIKVTKSRFPEMQHIGDIGMVNGAELPPVDIVSGGSPCQDMSIAGRRQGLKGERSVLFMDYIRVVKEMRKKTWKAKVHGVGKRPGSVLQQQRRGLPMRSRRNRRDRRAGSFYSSTSEREMEKRRGNRGRRVFHRLEGAGCAILGSPPAQKTNLSCRRF